jgi:hypothetical protein
MRFPLPSPRALSLGGALGVLSLVGVLGCGTGKQYEGKVFPVEGSLRYKDGTSANDLGGGTLELESSGKEVIKSTISGDGTFTREERIPPGKYRARIIPPPPQPDAEYDLDAKFKSFDTSGLTVTIGEESPQRPTITLTRTQRQRPT